MPMYNYYASLWADLHPPVGKLERARDDLRGVRLEHPVRAGEAQANGALHLVPLRSLGSHLQRHEVSLERNVDNLQIGHLPVGA